MGYDMTQIKNIFLEGREKQSLQQKEEIKTFITELEGFRFAGDFVLSDADQSVLYYIAGYIAKSVMGGCDKCDDIISPGKVPLQVSFENSNETHDMIKVKEEFIQLISRGGLTKPSDYLYIASLHATSLYSYISNDDTLIKSLLATDNPRDTFVDSFMHFVQNDDNASRSLIR